MHSKTPGRNYFPIISPNSIAPVQGLKSPPAFLTRVVIHRPTQDAVLLRGTAIKTYYSTEFNSRTLEKSLGSGVALGYPAIWAQALYKEQPQVPPLQKWDRKHIVSGSHHQTPSFPLVRSLSITDGHTDKEQPGTDLALPEAHPFTSRESRGGRQKLCSIFLQKKTVHTWKQMWVVLEKESSAW